MDGFFFERFKDLRCWDFRSRKPCNLESELGGPSGKLFRFVSCVRARGAYVRSDLGENPGSASFPFPFSPWEVFPFPSALQGPIQLQLALSGRRIFQGQTFNKWSYFTLVAPCIGPWFLLAEDLS